MPLDRIGYGDLGRLLDDEERRTFLRLLPALWRLGGAPPLDGASPGGVSSVLGAMLRVPVKARAAVTQVAFEPAACSRLGERHSGLGNDWVLGAGVEEVASRIAVVIEGLGAEDVARLTKAGWVEVARGGLGPAAKLRALAECVCPAWLEIDWSIGGAAPPPPSEAWVLGKGRLGADSVLGEGGRR